jgi:hypothetical protein
MATMKSYLGIRETIFSNPTADSNRDPLGKYSSNITGHTGMKINKGYNFSTQDLLLDSTYIQFSVAVSRTDAEYVFSKFDDPVIFCVI